MSHHYSSSSQLFYSDQPQRCCVVLGGGGPPGSDYRGQLISHIQESATLCRTHDHHTYSEPRVTLNSERPDFCRLLQEVLSFLPQGTADYGGGGEQTPLVLALERGRLEVCEVLASFMGEEGFLAVDGKGESFVHRVVRRLGYCRDLQLMRGLEANPNNEDSLRDDHLRFIKDTVCGRVEPQRLLTLRNQSGLTAADLAQQLEMPFLAGQLRPMTAKAARS